MSGGRELSRGVKVSVSEGGKVGKDKAKEPKIRKDKAKGPKVGKGKKSEPTKKAKGFVNRRTRE